MKARSSRKPVVKRGAARGRSKTKTKRASAPKGSKAGGPPTPQRIMQFAWGFGPTLILNTAIELRLFDLLQDGPRTVEDLAKETGCSQRGLSAVLNALVGFEFLARKGKAFALTPESAAFLVSTSPDYHGGFFGRLAGQILPDWLSLTEAVRAGRPARMVNEQQGGAEFFAELVEGIFPMSYRAAQVLGKHLGIGKVSRAVSVLDIGAGSGVWGIALAEQSPQVSIVAVDWPTVLEVTKRIVERRGLSDRLRTSPGDLLEADFGSGHQIATIGHILHSEGPQRSKQLLKRVYDALAPGGTVAIAEFVPNEDRTGPPNALIFAVNMLIHTNDGDTFTFKEISAWLREAGFTNIRSLEAPAPSPLVLATKP